MSKNLDLESWEKQNNSQKKQKISRLDGFSHPKTDEHNLLPKNLLSLYKEAMEDDKITDVIVPNKKHTPFRLLVKVIFFLSCCFFILAITRLIYTEQKTILILFLIPPIFIILNLFETSEKLYFIIGKKSFYYVELMDRPIFYSEIKDVQLITAKLKHSGSKKRFYQQQLLCFFFHDEVYEDIVGEAYFLRNIGQYDDILSDRKNLAIFPRRFPIPTLISIFHNPKLR